MVKVDDETFNRRMDIALGIGFVLVGIGFIVVVVEIVLALCGVL